jgi:hypothetical protein
MPHNIQISTANGLYDIQETICAPVRSCPTSSCKDVIDATVLYPRPPAGRSYPTMVQAKSLRPWKKFARKRLKALGSS